MNRYEILMEEVDKITGLSRRELRLIKCWSLAAYNCGLRNAVHAKGEQDG